MFREIRVDISTWSDIRMVEHLSTTPHADSVEIIHLGRRHRGHRPKPPSDPPFNCMDIVVPLEKALGRFPALRKMAETYSEIGTNATDCRLDRQHTSVFVQLLAQKAWPSLKDFQGRGHTMIDLLTDPDLLNPAGPNNRPTSQALRTNLSQLTSLRLCGTRGSPPPWYFGFRLLSAHTVSLQTLVLHGVSLGKNSESVISFKGTIKHITLSQCEGSEKCIFGLIEPHLNSLQFLQLSSTNITSGSWLPLVQHLEKHGKELTHFHVHDLKALTQPAIYSPRQTFASCNFGRAELQALASLFKEIAPRSKMGGWFSSKYRNEVAGLLLQDFGVVLDS